MIVHPEDSEHTARNKNGARTHTHTHAEPCSLFQNVILSTLWFYSLKHADILGALHTNTWPSQVYFIFCLVLYFFRRPPKIESKSRELGPFETTEFAVPLIWNEPCWGKIQKHCMACTARSTSFCDERNPWAFKGRQVKPWLCVQMQCKSLCCALTLVSKSLALFVGLR